MPKSNEIVSLDVALLEAVTGGGAPASPASPIGGSSNNIDTLLSQLHSITGSLDDFKKKTNGLGSTEMVMLMALAMRNNQQPSNTVVVVPGGPRRWW